MSSTEAEFGNQALTNPKVLYVKPGSRAYAQGLRVGDELVGEPEYVHVDTSYRLYGHDTNLRSCNIREFIYYISIILLV